MSFACRWLVGCDGGRSTVRKAAGFEFTGTDPEFTGYSVQAELDDPAVLKPGRSSPAGESYLAEPLLRETRNAPRVRGDRRVAVTG